MARRGRPRRPRHGSRSRRSGAPGHQWRGGQEGHYLAAKLDYLFITIVTEQSICSTVDLDRLVKLHLAFEPYHSNVIWLPKPFGEEEEKLMHGGAVNFPGRRPCWPPFLLPPGVSVDDNVVPRSCMIFKHHICCTVVAFTYINEMLAT
jgi:hypothetical protein